MGALNVNALRSLIAHEAAPCLTIYLPTLVADARDVQVRWSAALAQARKSLSKLPHLDVDAFLAPLHELSAPARWGAQPGSLAVFRSSAWMAHYFLPVRIEPAVVVSDRFRLRPLLQYARTNQRYFLLELSHGRVSFFEGSAEGLVPRSVLGLPASAADVHGLEHTERMPGLRDGGNGLRGGNGQGHIEAVKYEDELKFVRAIDKALKSLLHDETAPLVVVGTGKLLPLFQSRCTYPHRLEEAVHGSFANAPLEELHAKSWPLVQAHLAEREKEIVELHKKLVSVDRATDEITSMARSAVQGRVRELLVARDAHVWGRMDPTNGAVQVHELPTAPLEEDVLDGLVEAVILRGGDVYTIERSIMPTRSAVAATMRW